MKKIRRLRNFIFFQKNKFFFLKIDTNIFEDQFFFLYIQFLKTKIFIFFYFFYYINIKFLKTIFLINIYITIIIIIIYNIKRQNSAQEKTVHCCNAKFCGMQNFVTYEISQQPTKIRRLRNFAPAVNFLTKTAKIKT